MEIGINYGKIAPEACTFYFDGRRLLPSSEEVPGRMFGIPSAEPPFHLIPGRYFCTYRYCTGTVRIASIFLLLFVDCHRILRVLAHPSSTLVSQQRDGWASSGPPTGSWVCRAARPPRGLDSESPTHSLPYAPRTHGGPPRAQASFALIQEPS